MNLIHPILADMVITQLRQQAEAAGAISRFKVDELSLWHTDQQASRLHQACKPHTGPGWLSRVRQAKPSS